MRTAEGNENVGRVRGWRARINGESMSRGGVKGLSRGREGRGARAGAGISERAKMPLRSRESGVSMI